MTIVMILSIAIFAVKWKQRNTIRAVYELNEEEIDTLLKSSQSKQKGGMGEDGNDDEEEDRSAQTMVVIDRNVRCSRCR